MWDIFRPEEPAQQPQKPLLPSIQQDKPSRQSTAERLETPSRDDSIEMRARLRELEIQMFDIRSHVDRRLASATQEFPNRLHKELKLINERDSSL